jgi:hypothetical protein
MIDEREFGKWNSNCSRPLAMFAVIAIGRRIRELKRLERAYGKGRWRKLKGKALIRFVGTGVTRVEEVHWYEAHGIGKREFKVKFRPR